MPSVLNNISFGTNISTFSFENILKLDYANSLESDHVFFDFSQVEWCETPELSLIALWICELLKRNKKVTFKLPLEEPLEKDNEKRESAFKRRISVYSYLAQCRFMVLSSVLCEISLDQITQRGQIVVHFPHRVRSPMKFHLNTDKG
jgi:hypothetical protein